MLAATAPYLYGGLLTGSNPAFGWYSWTTFYSADAAVYLAWIREAADGAFFHTNLFNTIPQAGHGFSLCYAAIGAVARLTHMSVPLAYHLARICLGIAFLRTVWWLLEMTLARDAQRRIAYLLICTSSGFGWTMWLLHARSDPALHENIWRLSNDLRQPESITFTALSFAPHFIAGLLLLTAMLGCLLAAEIRGSTRLALCAGLCGMLLANIHTYDAMTVWSVWIAYLLVRAVIRRRIEAASWRRAAIALAMTSLSAAYEYYSLKAGGWLDSRNTDAELSAPLWNVLFGFGGPLILASISAAAIALSLRRDPKRSSGADEEDRPWRSSGTALFFVVWAVVSLAIIYVPTTFQRRLLMGAHIPICALAAVALAGLLRRIPISFRAPALAAAIVALAMTNVGSIGYTILKMPGAAANPFMTRKYLLAGEYRSLLWLRANTPPGTSIQPLPWLIHHPDTGLYSTETAAAAFAPSITGRPVDLGHYCESFHSAEKLRAWTTFLDPAAPDSFRRDLLRRSGVRYLMFSQKRLWLEGVAPRNVFLGEYRRRLPSYLRPVPAASNADADLYEVIPSELGP
jgi:hypothetical protein